MNTDVILIKKAKIKDELFLEYSYTEQLLDHKKKEIKGTCTVPIHQDLKDAFAALTIHLAIICDELPNNSHLKDKLMNYTTGGLSLSAGTSDEDGGGIVIYGLKSNKYGLVKLDTPIQHYDDSEYAGMSELAQAVEAVIYEVKEYLFNGKRAPDKQIEMDFEEGDTSTIDPAKEGAITGKGNDDVLAQIEAGLDSGKKKGKNKGLSKVE